MLSDTIPPENDVDDDQLCRLSRRLGLSFYVNTGGMLRYHGHRSIAATTAEQEMWQKLTDPLWNPGTILTLTDQEIENHIVRGLYYLNAIDFTRIRLHSDFTANDVIPENRSLGNFRCLPLIVSRLIPHGYYINSDSPIDLSAHPPYWFSSDLQSF